jgi:hypothetical protein
MLKFLRSLIRFRSKRVPEGFGQAAEIYVNLVKSRTVGAVVVREELLLPPDTTAERNYGLLTALCAYFIARTDTELERRAVPEPLREYVWSAIPEAVLEEMSFTGVRRSLAMRSILGQSGIFRGVIETHGAENATVLAKTLLVMAPAPRAPQSDTRKEEVDLTVRISVLLEKFNLYGRYLDRMVAQASGGA